MIFIMGLTGMVIPGRASLTFNIGDTANGSTATQISNWDTASGLNYALDDTTFTGSLSGSSPFTYTDPLSTALFEGFNLTGGDVNGAANNLAISGTALQETGGIIEITNLPANTFAFAADFTLAQAASLNGYCIEINHSSFNQNSNCDDEFAMTNSTDVVFVGVVSTTAITNIWIGPSNNTAENLQINDFDVPGDVTPESRTLFLLGAGLILIGAIHRRRMRASAPCV